MRTLTIGERAVLVSDVVSGLSQGSVEELGALMCEELGLSPWQVLPAVSHLVQQVEQHALVRLVEREGVWDATPSAFMDRALVLPGTVGTVIFEELLLSLVLGVSSRVHCSTRLGRSGRFLFELLRSAWTSGSRRPWPVTFHVKRLDLRTVSSSEHLIFFGGAVLERAVEAQATAGSVTAFGDVQSIAVVGSGAWNGSIAERLRVDVGSWGSRGCMSPSMVFLEERLRIEVVANSLSAASTRDDSSLVGAIQARDELSVLCAMRGGMLLPFAGTVARVWPSGAAPQRLAYHGIGGVDLVVGVSADNILTMVNGEKTNGGYLGVSSLDSALGAQLDAVFGASATWPVRLGEMQRPRVDHPHQGQHRLRSSLR